MKKYLFLIFAVCHTVAIHSQTVIVGDMDNDGKLTVQDVTRLVSTLTGQLEEQKITINSDFQALDGEWENKLGGVLSFDSKGQMTASLSNDIVSYKYMPQIGVLILLNNDHKTQKVYNVIQKAENFMTLCEYGTDDSVTYYKKLTVVDTPSDPSKENLSKKRMVVK